MNLQNMSTQVTKGMNATDLWCPNCGSPMYEADKLHEGHYSFVWFECSKHGCNGQWLHKTKLSESRNSEKNRIA